MERSSSCEKQIDTVGAQWRIFIAVLLAFAGVAAKAQHHFFQEYSIRDGLAASKVYAVTQDRNGFVWLGTVNGVSRFDGHRFENFTTVDGLAPQGVRTILEDHAGSLWFGHYEGGITRYKDGQFEEFTPPTLKGEGDISDLYAPRKGELWIASNGLGAIHLSGTSGDAANWQWKQFRGAQGLSDRVFDLSATKDGTLYFVTDVGIKSLKGDSTFAFYKPGAMTNMFQLTCMLEDSRGMRWFGTHNGGLYKFAPGNSDIEIIDVMDGLAHNFVFCLQEDVDGNIWAGTYGGGISVISPNGNITTLNNENGLPDERIQSLTIDRENNVLIGTNDNGLLVFKSFQFEHYPLPDRYGVRRYNAIARHLDDQLWIGTERGLFRANDQCAAFEHYGVEDGLLDPRINAMTFDRSGVLWVGTEFGGLFSFLPGVGQFRSHFLLNQYITQNKVTDLCVDINDRLWVGTLDGLLVIESNRQQLNRMSQRDGLESNQISAVFPLQSGTTLVGQVGRGVSEVRRDTALTLISSGTPSCFLEDQTGQIWVGMEGQGLYRIIPGERSEHWTRADGLLSNAITTLQQDHNGDVWIGSNFGLTKYDAQEQSFTHYGLSAGFGGVEVKRQAGLVWDEALWYGTANGVFRNVPDREKHVYPPGPVFFREIKVNEQTISDTGVVDLAYDQNELEFDFVSVSLTDPENVQFQTFLEGRDAHWSDWTNDSRVVYPALPEGNYTFKVRVRNRWGEEATVSAPVSFTIHPPWYRSTAFYVLAALAALILLIAYIKLRERNLRREKRILAAKVKQRTQEVVQKSEELAMKNADILDSINYARRIQEAILVPESVIASFGLETFVLYQPKDIVSGDFYWFTKIGNKVLFAAADCTGHGVPGAFMSVVGYSLLDKIAIELDETRPEVILQELSLGVEKFLRQKENEKMPKDGMDMALAVYDEDTATLEFSGAFNPLYIVRDKALVSYPADRFSVGSYDPDSEKRFTRHTIAIQPGDCVYVFSDGFVDQFGGPDYKKFKSRNFKELLTKISDQPMRAQRAKLEQTLHDWKGDREQLDDILVMGVRF